MINSKYFFVPYLLEIVSALIVDTTLARKVAATKTVVLCIYF